MDELENALNLLRNATDEFSRSGTVSANTFNQMSVAGTRSAAIAETSTKATGKFGDRVAEASRKVWDMSNAIRENRESISSLTPTFRILGSAVQAASSGIGNAASDAGNAMMMTGKKWGMVAGLITKGLGASADLLGKGFQTVANDVLPEVVKQLENYIESYKQAGSIGVTGAMAIQGLADTAASSGLSVTDFTNILVSNSHDLQQGFGTAYEGSQQLAQGLASLRNTYSEANNETTSYLNQLRNLGFVTAETAQNMLQVQKLEVLSGQKSRLSSKELSQRTFDYTKNLDLLTRITGQRREQVEAEFKQMQKEASFKAGMLTFGKQFGEGGRTLIQSVAGMYGQDVGKGLLDALGTGQIAASEESIKLNAALGGQLPEIMKMVQNTGFSQESVVSAVKQMNAIFQQQGQARFGTAQQAALLHLKGDELVRLMAGVFLDSKTTAEKTAVNFGQMIKDQASAISTQAEAQKGINIAQSKLQDLGVQLDQHITKMLPLAGKAVSAFATVTTESATLLINTIADLASGKSLSKIGENFASRGSELLKSVDKAITEPVGAAAKGAAAGVPSQADINSILRLIAKVESKDYSSANPIGAGSNQINGLENKTIEELLKNSKGSQWTINGKPYSALGRYQFQPDTLREMLDSAGVALTDKFSDLIQDKLARALVNKQGFESYKSGQMSKEDLLHNLAKRWAGLPGGPDGKSLYSENNQAGMSWEAALGSFKNGGISAGPKSGYRAMLHGTEAVVPLPGSRSIPVEFNNTSSVDRKQIELLEKQMTKLDEIIYQMQTANTTSYQMLRNSMN